MLLHRPFIRLHTDINRLQEFSFMMLSLMMGNRIKMRAMNYSFNVTRMEA